MVVQETGEITGWLRDWARGDVDALQALLPRVLADLQRLATHYFRHERASPTFESSDLVQEVYMRLMNIHEKTLLRWENRKQFFAFASLLMRRLLVEHARRKGGKVRLGSLTTAVNVSRRSEIDPEVLLDLHRALELYEEIDPRGCRIVELRFFLGLTVNETAIALGISRATVVRDWAAAQRWLALRLGDGAASRALRETR